MVQRAGSEQQTCLESHQLAPSNPLTTHTHHHPPQWQTVLVDWQGQHWHIPNSKLLAETIVNVTRSDTMGDEFAIWVDLETDFNIVDVLYEELDNFRKANPQHFGEWVS